jgi:hypothetical protein
MRSTICLARPDICEKEIKKAVLVPDWVSLKSEGKRKKEEQAKREQS